MVANAAKVLFTLHSIGLFEQENGDKYEGDWKDDLKNGKGVIYYANGEIYDGEWKNDKYCGKGKRVIKV